MGRAVCPMSKPSENEIIATLMGWVLEVESFRNDGWTRYHYLNKIMKVKKYVDEHLEKYESVQRERFSSDQSRSD